MKKTILISGATGTIGFHLVDVLHSTGAPVEVLTRSSEKAASFTARGIPARIGDLSETGSLTGLFSGVDSLFLLTNAKEDQVSVQNGAIDAARKAGVRKIVKLSALGADLNAPISLGRWHAQTEEHLKQSGLDFVILQPHFFMQNFLGQAGAIKAQGAFYSAIGDAPVSMIDTRDISEVAAKVLTSDAWNGQTLVLTGPEASSLPALARAIGTAISKEVRFVGVPFEAEHQTLLSYGMPQWFADDLVTLSRIFAAGHGSAVTSAVKEITGTTGRTVADFAEAYKSVFA